MRVEVDHSGTIDGAQPPDRLSVLHVAQPVVGGVARCVADLVADQAGRGWDVAVACPEEGELAEEIRAAGAAHLPWTAWREPGLHSLGETRTLARILSARRPELVHLHSSKAGLAGRLALRGSLPTLFQPNGWSFEAVDGLKGRAAARWERFATRWSDLIVCVSEVEQQRGEHRGLRASWRVVPNGVDLDDLAEASPGERAAARQELGLEDRPTVVCIGRLSRQKGQDVLIDAWPSVAARLPGAQLVLVGDGPEESALRERAVDGIRFAGWRSDVGSWLAAADVVTLPSRWEGMSIVMLEAMARGRSVVATDVAGAREALGDAGAVVPVGDARSLGDALVKRLLDPKLAESEGHAARRRAVAAHSVETVTATVASLYGEVLSSRR